MFSQASVSHSFLSGGGGMHGWGMRGGGMCGRVASMARRGGGEGLLRGRRDGHCSGRYASYWNAFLLGNIFGNYKQMLTM